MEELIKLYLLEQPHSVSDMIRALTEKELSSAAPVRSKEIPKIAGNWFKKETGYIWRLREDRVINDVGRQYALNKTWLVEGLLDDLGIRNRFPDHAERGDVARVESAYTDFMPEYTLGDFKRALRDQVFSGAFMKDVFAFEDWRDIVLAPQSDGRRISLYEPVFEFWSFVHLAVLSSIFKSRYTQLSEQMESEDRYFTWKNRRTRLRHTETALVEKMMLRCFPWAEQDESGAFIDERVERIASAFGQVGAELPDETVELLGDMYLLYFDDGAGLFEQRREADEDIHLFLNLLERGALVKERDLDRDPTTGDYIVPLTDMHAYLEDLAALSNARPVLKPNT